MQWFKLISFSIKINNYFPLFRYENCLLTSKPITLHTLVKYSFQLQVIEIVYFKSFGEIISIS